MTLNKNKRRRVIFNCDSSEAFNYADGNLDTYIQNIFTGMEDSHVGALLWCDGSGGNTARYESSVLELDGYRIGKVSPALLKWIAGGNDPPKVIVREAKKRGLDVFYSFRLNDIHDNFLPEEFPTFKEEHPDWMIGEGQPYGYKTALSFAIPEVRRLKFAIIEEIFQRYDFDGLEIDFLRSPPFFMPGEEPASAHILTQFLRDVRKHLHRRGQECGRHIELAARVDEHLEACRLDGFDVATWVREKLVDILILGSGVIDISVEEFKQLVEGTDVLIYPCLYGWPSHYMPVPPELARGLAMNYWHQGADGIYTFNWFPFEPDKTYQIALLNEIGDYKALHGKPLIFAADRGRPAKEYPHNWMRVALPVEIAAGCKATVPIMVGENFTGLHPSRLELHVECGNLSDTDILTIRFNQNLLPNGSRSDSCIIIPLTPGYIKQGRNEVTIHLNSGQLAVTAIEIHIG